MTDKKIVVHYAYPPIPIRTMDYIACYDGEQESQQYGYGRTEEEAINDLKETYS